MSFKLKLSNQSTEMLSWTSQVVKWSETRLYLRKNSLLCRSEKNKDQGTQKLSSCLDRSVGRSTAEGAWLDGGSAFQLSALVLCVHVPCNVGAVALIASAMHRNVVDLTSLEIASSGLLQGCFQLYIIQGLVHIFRKRMNQSATFCSYRFTKEALIHGILFAMGAIVLSLGMSTANMSADLSPGESVLYQADDPLARLLAGVDAVLITPILEELVHRGILLPCLLTALSIPQSLFTSSFVFATLHFSGDAFPSHFVSAVVFSVAYLSSEGNLLIPTIAHGLFNAVALTTFINA